MQNPRGKGAKSSTEISLDPTLITLMRHGGGGDCGEGRHQGAPTGIKGVSWISLATCPSGLIWLLLPPAHASPVYLSAGISQKLPEAFGSSCPGFAVRSTHLDLRALAPLCLPKCSECQKQAAPQRNCAPKQMHPKCSRTADIFKIPGNKHKRVALAPWRLCFSHS